MSEGIEIIEEQTPGDGGISTPFSSFAPPPKPGFSLIELVQKLKIAQDETQARYILIGVAIALFLIAIAIMVFFVFGVGKPTKYTYDLSPAEKAMLPKTLQKQIDAAQTDQKNK